MIWLCPFCFQVTPQDLTTTYSRRAFTPVTFPISNAVEADDKNGNIENIGVTHAGAGQNVSNKCDSIKVAVKGFLNFNKFKRNWNMMELILPND